MAFSLGARGTRVAGGLRPRFAVGCSARVARIRSSSTEAGSLLGLRYQFAAESFGQQRGRQAFDLSACSAVAVFEAVGGGEQGFDAADDLALLVDNGG